MDCSLPHTIEEIKAEVMKQVDEDRHRSQAIIDTTMIFTNTSKAKDDMIKAYN